MKRNYKNLVLDSSAPLDDGGRKLNIIYYVCGILSGFCGFMYAKSDSLLSGVILLILLGLACGWIIKNAILYVLIDKFRKYTFKIDNKIPYNQLITQLNDALASYQMLIEAGKNGAPVINYKDLIYDIYYNDDDTFTIWWRLNIARALFNFDRISKYRKVSATCGILAYTIQKICNNQ